MEVEQRLALGVGILIALPACGYHSLLNTAAKRDQAPIAVMPFSEPSTNGVAADLQSLLISELHKNGIAADNAQSMQIAPPGTLMLQGKIAQSVAGAGTSNVAAGVFAYNLSLTTNFSVLQSQPGNEAPQTLITDQVRVSEEYLAGRTTTRFDGVLGTEGARDVAESRALKELARRIVQRLLLHRSLDAHTP